MPKLIFSQHPAVTICTNTFIDVPVIVQYDDTPLIQVVKAESAGYTTEIPIYHPDGTYLAKVKGSRIFLTTDGEKARLILRHPQHRTVCELDGNPLFEIERTGPAAFRAAAELYAPDGTFIKCSSNNPHFDLIRAGQSVLKAGNVSMRGCTFCGCRIAIHLKSDGTAAVYVK